MEIADTPSPKAAKGVGEAEKGKEVSGCDESGLQDS